MFKLASIFSRVRIAVCLSLFLTLACLPAIRTVSAHSYSASYTTITLAKSGTEVVYAIDELSVIEWVGGDDNDDKMLDQEEFATIKDDFAQIFAKNISLKIGGQLQPIQKIESYALDREGDATKVILTVLYPAVSGAGAISLTDTLYEKDSKTNYVDLLTIHYGTNQSTAALSGGNRSWAMQITDEDYAGLPEDTHPSQASESASEHTGSDAGTVSSHPSLSGWLSFFNLGIHHILGGYDHLLFLFSLLIARQSFKQYAAMITAFTLAHSITLTLTVLGWIAVPGSYVEPLIALSICYVAVDNMLRPQVSYRWVLTFLFGLIHGMGFADILMEMNIPKAELGVDLVGFNLGIEAVQLALVGLLVPVIYTLSRYKHARKVVLAGSSVALLLGGVWFIERVL